MKYLLDTLSQIIDNKWLYSIVEILLLLAFIIVITVIVLAVTNTFNKKSKVKKLEISLLKELAENSRISLTIEREQTAILKSIVAGGSLVMNKEQPKEMNEGWGNTKLP